MTKQNDILNYTAQAYSNAETVGTVGDTTVFVPQMIVGEQATVKVNYAKRNIAYADVINITNPSPHRQTPSCKYFGECGGCTLMHMDYAQQLVFKQTKVKNNLAKIGGINAEVLPCVASPQVLGYRNKLSLPVRGKIGHVQIGMYKKGSHDLVNMDNCLLGDSWSTTLVKLFRDFLNFAKLAPYNEKTFNGQIRHLVARYVEGQLLVTVVTNGNVDINWQSLISVLQQHFPSFGLFQNVNTHKNNVILGNITKHIFGLPYIEGTHLGVKFRLRPDSFFQVNNQIKDAIYLKVKQLLDLSNTQVLVDAFSGIGILTTVLASTNYQTYAVEIVPEAVKDADEIRALNNSPVINICGDVNVELPKLTQEHSQKVLTLVVDPPRKGLGENICQTVLSSNFNNIVYISCDSATLARDLKQLAQGYNVNYVQPYDMFPNTAEVETVVHLVRK